MYLRIAGNITAAVTEDCAYLIVIWSPVDKAQQYYVRVRETGVGIDTATVDDNMYKTSLSSERVKELSIEVYHISTICNNVDFVISQVSAVLDKSPDTQKYSDPITINTKGLHNPIYQFRTLCNYCFFQELCTKAEAESEQQEQITTTHFSIGVGLTFLVTTLAVSFLTSIICLLVGSYRRKRYNLKMPANTAYFDSPLETKGDENET